MHAAGAQGYVKAACIGRFAERVIGNEADIQDSI